MNKQPLSPEKALSRAQSLCARCEQAPEAIRTKMLSWGLSSRDAEKLISSLKRDGYLDENRYARAFVHDKFEYNHWGRNKIAFELKRNGISGDIIAEAMFSIDDDEYRDAMNRVMREKACSLRGKTSIQARAAVARFAASRGIEPHLVFDFLDQMGYDEQD